MRRIVSGVRCAAVMGVTGALLLGGVVAASGAGAAVLAPPSTTTLEAVASDGTYLWLVEVPSSLAGGTGTLTRVDIATGSLATTSLANLPSGSGSFSITTNGSSVVVVDTSTSSSVVWVVPSSLTPSSSPVSISGSSIALSGNDLYAATPSSNVVNVYSIAGGVLGASPIAHLTLGASANVSTIDPQSLSIESNNLWVVTGGSSNVLYEYTVPSTPTTGTLSLNHAYSLYAGATSASPAVPATQVVSSGSNEYVISSSSGQQSSVFEYTPLGAYVSTISPVGSDVLKAIAVDASHLWAIDATTNSALLVAPPGAVSALSAAVTSSSVTLTWTQPSTTGAVVTNYLVQYSTDGGTSWTSEPLVAGSTTSATVSGLLSPANDLFRVGALNALTSSLSPYNGVSFDQISVPSAPVGVTARAGAGEVTVAWSAPTSTGGLTLSGYQLQESTNGGATWSPALSSLLGPSVTTYTVSGLTNGATYLFRVAAVNSLGESPFVSSLGVIPSTVPLAPQSVSGTASAPGAVTLNWVAPLSSGGLSILYYDVQYSATGGATWTKAGSSVGAATTTTVSGLTNGVGYLFRVAAVSNTGEGPFTNVPSLITPVGPPSAPQSVVATMSVSTSATVSWKAPVTTGGLAVTSWVVQYSTTKGATWVNALSGVASSASSAVVGGLSSSQHYLFRVAAVNYVGTGVFSSGVAPITLSSAPRSVSAVFAGNQRVLVSWITPSYTGAGTLTGYVVEESSTGGKTWTIIARPSASTLTLSVSKLSLGTTYLFQVAGVDSAGTGAFGRTSPIVAISTPSAPRGIDATPAGSSSALVRWTSPSSTGASVLEYYVLQASATGGKTWTVVNGGISTSAYSYTVTGLANGVKYLFRVAAVNAAGQGAFVTTRSLVPVGAPSAPQSVSAGDVAGHLVVSWRPPASNGGSALQHFVVQESPNGGVNWRGLATLPATVTTYSATRLASGGHYLFRVAALNATFASPFAQTTTPVTYFGPPSSPLGLRVVSNENSTVVVTWSPPSSSGGSAVAGYIVRLSTNRGASWTAVTAPTGQSSRIYRFSGLDASRIYFFDVAALNATSEGAFSSPLQVRPQKGHLVTRALPITPYVGHSVDLRVSASQRRALLGDLTFLVRHGVRQVTLLVVPPKGVAESTALHLAREAGQRVSAYLHQLARVSRLGNVALSLVVTNAPATTPVLRLTYLWPA